MLPQCQFRQEPMLTLAKLSPETSQGSAWRYHQGDPPCPSPPATNPDLTKSCRPQAPAAGVRHAARPYPSPIKVLRGSHQKTRRRTASPKDPSRSAKPTNTPPAHSASASPSPPAKTGPTEVTLTKVLTVESANPPDKAAFNCSVYRHGRTRSVVCSPGDQQGLESFFAGRQAILVECGHLCSRRASLLKENPLWCAQHPDLGQRFMKVGGRR